MFLFRTIIQKASQWLTSAAAASLRSLQPIPRWPGNPVDAGMHRGGSVAVNPAVPHVFRRAMRHFMLAILSVAAFAAVDLKAATPSQVEGSWQKVACPFDASKALLPVTCGRLKVPENYDKPGRVVELAVMIVKARRNMDPKNPVLFLNGGPGQTSLSFAETLVTNPLINDVVVDRDWVFFDQRGTGRSIPRLCPDPDEQGNPFDLIKCRDDLIKQGIDLSEYNSARISSDMEALRKALDMNQWNLWGISYGSRLAITMARYYPSSVRSIVHDAPGLPGGQELVDDARGTEVALNKLFSKCAADAACSSKFPQLRSRFSEALPRLRQQSLSVGDQRYDDSRVIRFIRNWLYPRGNSTYEQRIQNLLIVMDAAARGDGQLMVDTQQKMRKEEGLDKVRPPEPIHARQSIGLNLSVYCREKKPFESMEEYRRAQGSSEILRAILRGSDDDCALWPAGQAEPITNTHVYYDGPQLAFTGELDASSSGLAGYQIEMLYANARNVVFRNGMHGQFPTELPNSEDRDYWMCALRLGHQFFADPQRKLDTGCAATRQLRLVR